MSITSEGLHAVAGVDFTSRPTTRKPITVALGRLDAHVVRLERVQAHADFEGYPGLLAREVLGKRSYKSDEKAKQTPDRLIARKDLVDALEQGRTRLGLRLRLSHAQRDDLVADASADRLDAVLCMMQAAWAARQPQHGVPPGVDPLEGWITSAQCVDCAT